MIANIVAWLTDPANRSDIVSQILAHLRFSVLAVVIAAVIAVPLGLWIGHTGRGKVVAVTLTGAARAIPTLGLLFFIVLVLGPHITGDLAFSLPSEIVLVILAIPPILSGTYAGIDEVDPAARDAAKGMGMRGTEVLRKVEIPCALPLFMSGLRSAFLQVIATATVAASVGLDGLGRFLIDGQAVRDYAQMASGAVLVALLAIVVDLLLALVQRLAVSPGVSGRFGRGNRTTTGGAGTTTDPSADARATDATSTSRDRDSTLVTTTTATES